MHDRSQAAAQIPVALVSLGCPKNQVDAEVMLGILEAAGHPIVEDAAQAAVVIVNTCAFIEPAQEEAIDALLDIAELKTAGSLRGLICSGCLTERHGEKLLQELPEVDVFIAPGAVERIGEAVTLALGGRRAVISQPLTYLYCSETPRWRSGPEWLAYLKIADGCDNRCSYCTVPSLRGRFRSRQPEDVRRELEALWADGVREVCLVAQDSTAYGLDLSRGANLTMLLRLVDETPGDGWIRLLYMHPARISAALIETMAGAAHILPYFDIPLQHVAPGVLGRMGRRGSPGAYLDLLGRIRRSAPQACVRTTFIVGFPGETEEDFETLLEFVREARLDRMSVFRYWPEEGTPAATLPDHVPIELADERLDELMQLQEGISLEVNRGWVGRRLRVLVESQEPEWGLSIGRSFRDAPEVDGVVKVSGLHPPGEFRDVVVTGAEIHDLRASPDGSPRPTGG